MTATLISAGLGVVLAVLCGWAGARGFDPRRGPRMIPYRPLMVLAVVWVLLMLVHLANLAGVKTGG
jgi:hypothetical protein